MKSRYWRNGLACAAASVMVFVLSGCRNTPEPSGVGGVYGGIAIRFVNPEGAEGLLSESDLVVVDVRTPGEFETGHLAGARNIDFNADDFEDQLDDLDRSSSYLVYCRSGNRSSRSLRVMERLGFRSVVHLDGGLRAWEAAGQAVEEGESEE